MKKVFRFAIMSMFVLTLLSFKDTDVHAKDSVSYSDVYSQPTDNSTQWRFIYVTKDSMWTKNKRISGQPQKGTYLKKGDFLYYSESGGESCSLSFALGLSSGIFSGNVSISVPIGKMGAVTTGTGLVAGSKGYYVIKAKKQVKPTITLIQYRKKNGNKWGKWGRAQVYNKSYTVQKIKPSLYKITK